MNKKSIYGNRPGWAEKEGGKGGWWASQSSPYVL